MRTFHATIVPAEVFRIAELRLRFEDGLALAISAPERDREREIEDVILDLAAALLGRSVQLGPALPSSTVPNGVRVHGLTQGMLDAAG